MNERLYRFLKYIAILVVTAWIGWSVYQKLYVSAKPGDYAYYSGSNYFEDGHYERALMKYNAALRENPAYLPAMRGRAETLIMLQRESEAIETYDRLIALQPDNPGYYANRGIAYDRLGEHRKALTDYEQALHLDPSIGDGPGWLTRFLRNYSDKPPGIADRAGYLRRQLSLPPTERLLRVPELDAHQRPYKQ